MITQHEGTNEKDEKMGRTKYFLTVFSHFVTGSPIELWCQFKISKICERRMIRRRREIQYEISRGRKEGEM